MSNLAAADTGDAPEEKLAVRLSRRITEEIAAEDWPVGEVLGSEPELLERYEVGRSVFREAVRLLEHSGVARMRRGPHGGLTVEQPAADAVVRAAGIYLDYRNTTGDDLHGVSEQLQTLAARLAAERIDEAGASTLYNILALEKEERDNGVQGDVPVGAVAETNLHLAIARLAGNPALELFAEVTFSLSRSLARRRTKFAVKGLYKAHADIAHAIIAGDPERATELMSAHLHEVGRAYD